MECPGIENYFPPECYSESNFREILDRCKRAITPLLPMEGAHLDCIEKQGYFSADVYQLEYIDEELFIQILEDPLNYFKFLGLAVHLLYKDYKESEAEERASQVEQFKEAENTRRLWFEFTGHREITPIGEISPPHYGKFCTITGTVVAVGKVSECIYEATFRCDICTSLQYVIQPMGQFQAPKACPSAKCSVLLNGPAKQSQLTFTRLKHSNIKVASQIISVIQTRYDSRTNEKHVDVIKVQLINHLIEKCFIMDLVTISGAIVEPKNVEGDGICSFYMLASSLISNEEEKFSPKDLKAIKLITDEPDIIGLMVASFAPSVSCNNMVKLGVLLSLVGGHDSENPEEEESVAFRGQIHTLLLGAPNKEKKEILNAAFRMAPISSYVDKNYTQNIVYDVKVDKSDETLHAGPVLQANKGVCCIDDLDVMKTQWPFVSEIMESQSFQVAKYSNVRSKPVDIAIVASSTPVGGTYRIERTLYENIKMPTDTLNKFDLIFHLVDEPDHQSDRNFTKKVLKNRAIGSQPSTSSPQSVNSTSTGSQRSRNQSLIKRLAAIDKESLDLLPRKLLVKYLQFVRSKIWPKFDEQANCTLFRFCQDYQEKAFRHVAGSSGHPSDNQLLASLMRLSLARARLEAKDIVTKLDVQDVIELIKFTRSDIFPKEVLSLGSQYSLPPLRRPIESSEGLVGLANKRCRSSNERFVRYLQDYFADHPETEFTVDDLWTIARSGPPVAKFEQMVDFLNLHGYILQCGNSRYRWVAH